MINHQQQDSNNNIQNKTTKFKTSCDGKDCNNAASYYLKIVLINKSGYFCDACKKSLETIGLVESTPSN